MVGLYEIKKSLENVSLQVSPSQTNDVMKGIDLKTLSTAIRPMSDDAAFNMRANSKWALSKFGQQLITAHDLWALANYADILQNIFGARKKETFRNGFDIKPIFAAATKSQEQEINGWIKKCNNNGQSLVEVFKEYIFDLDWDDDAYLLALKDYHINTEKEIVGADVTEILRLNPLTVELVTDKAQRLGFIEDNFNQSKKAYFDLNTRQLCFDPVDEVTGLPNLQAHYKVRTLDGFMYYNEGEILHKSLHNPSSTYGWSPLYSLYPKIMILITQDDFIRKYYGENKPPKGFLAFNTDNAKGLASAMDEIREKSKQNPHEIYPLVFNNKDSRKAVEYIDLSRTLQEMQFTENRNEFRNQIGAIYGVSPIFQNDMSTSGGLNNEGLQITITNRAVEDVQALFNDYVLPFIFEKNLGFTNWEVKLFPSEEEDEAFQLDLEKKELENVKLRLEMGQTVTQDKNGKFTIEQGELKLEKPTSDFVPFTNSEDSKKEVIVETPVQVSKKTPAERKEQTKFETFLEKELSKLVKGLNFKKKPTKKEIEKTVNQITGNIDKQLKAKSANRVKSIYTKSVTQVSKELGEQFTLGKEDRNVIEALKKNPTFNEAFGNMSKDLSKNLTDIIEKAYGKKDFTIDSLVKQLKEQTDVADNKLRQIARTESSKISLAARKTSYEKTGDLNTMKFKVIGPSDKRTGEDSKNIVKQVGEGKSWDEVVQIIQNNATKGWKVDKTSPLPRPNWRHVIVKVV
jgi:hypothetical protein